MWMMANRRVQSLCQLHTMDNQESLTSSAAPKPTFETLPTEIRLKVYDNLIGDAAIILDFETEPQNRRYSSSIKLSDEASETTVELFLKKQVSLLGPHSIFPTILAVSKKINAESTPVLYSENTFIIPYYRLEDVQTFFFIRIGQKNRDLIKNIEIHFSTPELWAAIGPNAWRRPVLSAIVPRCLKRLAMVHDWISTPLIDKRMSQGNQDLTMMANFLNMNIEYMPWLSKMAMGPGRQVSIVEEGTLVKRGQVSL